MCMNAWLDVRMDLTGFIYAYVKMLNSVWAGTQISFRLTWKIPKSVTTGHTQIHFAWIDSQEHNLGMKKCGHLLSYSSG